MACTVGGDQHLLFQLDGEETIAERLAAGDTVKISSFGTFMVRDKGPRMGRNPKTGEPAPVSPRRVAVFRPSGILKRQVEKGAAGTGDAA